MTPDDPSDQAPDIRLAEEFFRNPLGRHSIGLQHLLRTLRRGPVAGKFGLLCTRAGVEWILIQLSGQKGVDPIFHPTVTFNSIEDGEREVFARRWSGYFGKPLPRSLWP